MKLTSKSIQTRVSNLNNWQSHQYTHGHKPGQDREVAKKDSVLFDSSGNGRISRFEHEMTKFLNTITTLQAKDNTPEDQYDERGVVKTVNESGSGDNLIRETNRLDIGMKGVDLETKSVYTSKASADPLAPLSSTTITTNYNSDQSTGNVSVTRTTVKPGQKEPLMERFLLDAQNMKLHTLEVNDDHGPQDWNIL